MAKINVPREKIYTHGGAVANHLTPEEQLRRSVMTYLLWEGQFYEDGVSIAERISTLVSQSNPYKVIEIAKQARNDMKLRHVPLFLATKLLKTEAKNLVDDLLEDIIQRPDELAEFLAIYWKENPKSNGKKRQPIAAKAKKGLAKAFRKFNEYSLAKYNRDNEIKLRDVLRLVHPKPLNKEQEVLFGKLKNDALATPDTWEVAISAEGNKKEVWERLLMDKRLPGMAFMRNLRNMYKAGVDEELIKEGFKTINFSKLLPFRFITAANHVPRYELYIEEAMLKNLSQQSKLYGRTIIVVDVSGSMYGTTVSAKSEIDRAHAACGVAVLLREVCEDPVIFATAGDDGARIHKTQLVPARRGFALSDTIYKLCRPLGGGGIFLKQVMDYIYETYKKAERVIVITDEQDCDTLNSPDKALTIGNNNYIINVGSYDRGIAYKNWTHITGWSESVINFIGAYENYNLQR